MRKILKFFITIGVVAVITIDSTYAGATEEQMWSAGKLMRDVCQPKFPTVTNEIADNIKNGNFPDDKDVKCYINCVMEMMQAIKKGKFTYESSLKQVDILLPESYRDSYRSGLTVCKDSAKGIKNNCEAAYVLLKCLKMNIATFVFP